MAVHSPDVGQLDLKMARLQLESPMLPAVESSSVVASAIIQHFSNKALVLGLHFQCSYVDAPALANGRIS